MSREDAEDVDRSVSTSQSGETALLYSSPDQNRRGCLHTAGDVASDVACLTVTLTDTVDEVVDSRVRYQDQPAELAIITVGETTRSAATTGTSSTYDDLGRGVRSTTVSDASELTEIGIRINQVIKTWETDGSNVVLLCFDSLTPLIHLNDLQRVYRFLHILTSRLKQAGARSHFHVDPAAHDDQTLATLRSLFDATYPSGSH